MTLEIHYSQIMTWLRCPRQWYDRYWLNLEANVKASPLSFGHEFHVQKEMWLKHEPEPVYDVLTDDLVLVGKLFQAWKRWYTAQGLSHTHVEHELRVEVLPGVFVVGTVDGIVVDPNGETWIDETKTTASFDDRHLPLDLQGRIYDLLAYECGFDTSGVKYTQVRKQDPATAKTDIIKHYDIRHPEASRRITALTVRETVLNIMNAQDLLNSPFVEKTEDFLEMHFPRVANPLTWMSCFCDFQDACFAALMGREHEALEDLYHIREDTTK